MIQPRFKCRRVIFRVDFFSIKIIFSVGRFLKRGNKKKLFVLFWSSSSFRQKRSNNFGRLQTPSLRLEIFSPFQKKVEEEEEEAKDGGERKNRNLGEVKFFSLFHNDAQFFSLSYDLSIVWLHSNGLTYFVPLFTDQNKLNRLLLLIGCLMKGIEAKFLVCDPPFPLWNGWLTLTRVISYFKNFLISHFFVQNFMPIFFKR